MSETRIKPLQPQELAAFFESLCMLLRAGVPVNECAEIISSDMKGSPLATATHAVGQLLNGGEIFLLSEALEKSGYFPDYSIEMIRLGEESGRLEFTADSLGAYFRRQNALNQSIRSAISGPLLLIVIMGVVLFFLILFVLPVFENVFASLGYTSGGVGGAFVAARIAMSVVGVLLLAVLALVLMYVLPGGKAKLAKMAENFPATRRIHYNMSASRLAHALEMLLASGISAGEALEKAGRLVSNKRLTSKLPACTQAVNQGEDLGKSLVETGVLDGFEAKVLLSASRAGQTEVAMRRLAEIYANETDTAIDQLLGMLEPTMVGILSVAIGVILLSVMLPLTRIMSAII